MAHPDPSPAPGGRLLVGAAIVLLALNLRAAVGSVGVLLEPIREGLDMSAGFAGVVTTLPVLCFAAFGSTAPRVVARIGLHRTVVVLLGLTAVGLGLRAAANGPVLLAVLTVVALSGAAIGNVVLPPLAKLHFPDRLPLVSALYGAALMAGGALGSVASVPIADAFGTWRAGLGAWALLALVSLLPWLGLLRHDVRSGPSTGTVAARQLVRSPLAWALALCFGAQSAQAYAQFGWFPAILHDAGLSQGSAGSMQALLTAVGIPTTLALPLLIRWSGRLPLLPWFFALVTSGGWLGVLLAPTAAPWLWAVLLGVGGSAFTWTLAMIGRSARTPGTTAALSGFVQGVGYLVAAVGPFGVGLLHDLTDDWTVPVTVLAVAGLLIGVLGTVVQRGGTVEDQLPPR
ncbi:MAG: MFS transporter [Aeromicrobium erythreum]